MVFNNQRISLSVVFLWFKKICWLILFFFTFLILNPHEALAKEKQYQWTHLMDAAAVGDFSKVKKLSANKKNLNLLNENHENALAVAISNDQPEIALYLIQQGIDLDSSCVDKDANLLHCAVQNNQFNIIQELLKKKSSLINQPNKTGETPVFFAIKYSTLEVLNILLNSGADLNVKNKMGQKPLDLAKKINKKMIKPLENKLKENR